jgi:hypothetical protein
MSRKPWVKQFDGQAAVYSMRLADGQLEIRVGSYGDRRYIVMSPAEWARLPLA